MGKKAETTDAQGTDERSFEESLARLEQIVALLDAGRLDLQPSLESYEEGVGLLKHCRNLLENARQRIFLLRGCDEDGNPVLQEKSQEEFQSDERVPGRRTKSERPRKEEPAKSESSRPLFEQEF
ncbi:MAG: exodeoxyribonuclease VII small subunit [Planctomycetia bacterium]|nr:exodeoxyribonuclease VII small subunit [Planctomycetia bacterium]